MHVSSSQQDERFQPNERRHPNCLKFYQACALLFQSLAVIRFCNLFRPEQQIESAKKKGVAVPIEAADLERATNQVIKDPPFMRSCRSWVFSGQGSRFGRTPPTDRAAGPSFNTCHQA